VNQPGTALPRPTRTRWQPLRAGLVDLFYYDVEEFRFHDGRLLLRGNNGTGKSKVLALLLPFLLDGDLSPHRVEPDADPKKRMEWNLLLGGEHPHPERLGYAWLEFGRVADDGVPEFRTIGCGLKAVAGRGIARHWFFVTERRVGHDLALVDATATALTRERLVDALGGGGTVYDRAREYRRAVDEALFGLGEQRYGALVDLLVQLRQPQLSKRPSERALSAALTEALPPLDQAVVADVAEAFRSLEDDRTELASMADAHAAAQAFLGHYRRYAAVAARRRAELPRKAEQRYRSAREALAEAEAAYATAETEAATAQETLGELSLQVERLRARERALRASPEMRSARELEHAAGEAERRAVDARRAGTQRDRAVEALARRRRQRDEALGRVDAAVEVLAEIRGSAVQEAERARVGVPHRAEVDGLVDPARPVGRGPGTPAIGIRTTDRTAERTPSEGAPSADRATGGVGADLAAQPAEAVAARVTIARRAAADVVARQERAIAHVDGLLAAVDRAAAALAGARSTAERLADAAGQLAERRLLARSTVERRGRELVANVRAHLDAAVELAVPEHDAVLAALALWIETLDGPDPARVAIDAAARAATTVLARAEAKLEQQAGAAAARGAELAAEIARLEAGEHGAPPPPHTRALDARAERPGAPLWQLVDFADAVGAPERAGLEAALEAAGVLDAWLDPAGALRGPDGDLLVAAESTPVAVSLAEALRPAVDPDDPRAALVPDAAVERVLRAVGLGEHDDASTWVAPDGRFRIGVLTGAWRKPAAQYVGRGARETARRARLTALRREAGDVAAEQQRLAAAQRAVADRRSALVREQDATPDSTALREAHAAVGALVDEQRRLHEERAEADEALATAAEQAEAAAAELRSGADDVGLPPERGELDAVRTALAGYRVTLAGLWPAVATLGDARRGAADAVAEADTAVVEHESAAADAENAAAAAVTADEAHRTLRETVGAAVDELQRRLTLVAHDLGACAERQKVVTAEREEALTNRGRADGLRQGAARELEAATEQRGAATDVLRRFAGTGLLAVALPDLAVPPPDTAWAPDPTLRLARQVEQELAEVDTERPVWERVQRRVTDELKNLTDSLARHGNTASAQVSDEGIVVEVVFRGRPATVPDLAAALGAEVTDRKRLLDEREREILENHLVNEVASTLQELIAEAERQVGRMNDELDERPTSTGMRLRLDWQAREDGPAGLPEARRRLLRQTSDAWSADDRAAVGGFLQERIAEVRARDDTGTWLENLTTALDYRSWHRFVIERHQNGQWRPATGPASGGERVLAASVPLFAAASAHYGSAGNPHAPRLVTLDEAFAGVDDNARAKYLGLLAAFDLDVVMTSEREWGCYPEVPGLSIAQLSRREGVAAVLVTHWQWDGVRRRQVPRPAVAVAAAAAPAPLADSLFDDL
jgi:uncharacterized protein (TIGR02680 family)